jgi:hypothetical protein
MPQADQSNTTVPARMTSYRPRQSAYYSVIATTSAALDAAATAFMDEVHEAATYLKELHDYSLAVFAEVTGLHKNSILRLSDPMWIPNPETLQQLDRLIVRAEAKRRGETFPGETIKRGRPRKE